MEGIEVLKGAEVLRYGPQTTSGAINLLSTSIPSQARGSLKAEVGSFATRKLHASYGATVGQWGWLLETYQRESDGFHKLDRSTRTAGSDTAEYLGKLRWRSASGAAFAQQVELKVFRGDEDADVSYLGLTDADFRADPDRRYGLGELQRMDRGRKSASVRHQIEFTPRTQLTSTAYWTETSRLYKRLNQVNGIGIGQVANTINNGGAGAALLQQILDGTADTTHANGVRYGNNDQAFVAKGLQFELLHGFSTGGIAHEVTAGMRWHDDTTKNGVKGRGNVIYRQVNGSLVYESTATATLSKGEARAASFWLADRVTFGALKLMPVLRHERIRSHADVAQPKTDLNSNALNKTTVGLGANHALNPQWVLLGGVHQGFAPPGSGVANGTKGEESTNYEGGVRYRQGSLGFDAIAFYSDYTNAMRNCLVANPCPGGAIEGTQQTGEKKVYGLEFGLFADLQRGTGPRLPLRLAYTYTDGEYTKASDVAGGVLDGDVLEYAFKHMASVQLGMETAAGWKSYAALNYVSDACTTNTCGRAGVDTRFLRTESLLTLDLSTAYPLGSGVEVYARVDNVFDERSITSRGPDGARGNAGRAFAVGLRASF